MRSQPSWDRPLKFWSQRQGLLNITSLSTREGSLQRKDQGVESLGGQDHSCLSWNSPHILHVPDERWDDFIWYTDEVLNNMETQMGKIRLFRALFILSIQLRRTSPPDAGMYFTPH